MNIYLVCLGAIVLWLILSAIGAWWIRRPTQLEKIWHDRQCDNYRAAPPPDPEPPEPEFSAVGWWLQPAGGGENPEKKRRWMEKDAIDAEWRSRR